MSDETDADGLRERLTKQGEDTLGRMAEDLLANPVISGAIGRAFDAREKATAAQEAAFSALNIPSASDIERLTRRVRSVSQRLEGIEDGIDRLDQRLAGLSAGATTDERLDAIDAQLTALTTELAKLREALPAAARAKPAAKRRAPTKTRAEAS